MLSYRDRYALEMEPICVTWAGERTAHFAVPAGRTAACYRALIAAGIMDLGEITPGSHTVQFRVGRDADPDAAVALVRSIMEKRVNDPVDRAERIVEIPICYDPEFAPDLEAIARGAGVSPDAVADLHASGSYTVSFLGFSPGFPYIDGLPAVLHAPRLETPRTHVRAGSVGIAGARTGIYPQATPGGWRLIGATPARIFDPDRDPPALLASGDRIRFRQIGRDEFDVLQKEHA